MKTWYKQSKTTDSYWSISQVYIDGDDQSYDVELLIKLTMDHDFSTKDPDELKHQLSNNAWGIGHDVVTPAMVIDDPNKDKEYKKHFKRIEKANLDKPILMREKDGEIIDGYHRLSKAFLTEHPIKMIEVKEEDLSQAKIANFK